MQETFKKLEEISRKYDQVAMLGMDQKDFQRYFAAIYAETNNYFYAQSSQESRSTAGLVNLVFPLLKNALTHHIEKNFPATENSVTIFLETRELLLRLIQRDLRIGQRESEQSKTVAMNLRALRACGLNYQGFLPNQGSGRWNTNVVDDEALRYASDNIKEFTHFVFDIAQGNADVQMLLVNPPQHAWIALYNEVCHLNSYLALIKNESAA